MSNSDLFALDLGGGDDNGGENLNFSEAELLDPNLLGGDIVTQQDQQTQQVQPQQMQMQQQSPDLFQQVAQPQINNESTQDVGSANNELFNLVNDDSQQQQQTSTTTDQFDDNFQSGSPASTSTNIIDQQENDEQENNLIQNNDDQNNDEQLIEKNDETTTEVASSSSSSSSSSGGSSTSSLPSMYGFSNEQTTVFVDDAPLREFQLKHQQELNEKRNLSQQRHNEILEKADKDLNEFLSKRSEAAKKRLELHKQQEQEKAFLQDAPQAENIWKNVAALINPENTSRDNDLDVTRMRDVLISLKHN